MKKRILGFLLVLILVGSSLPVQAAYENTHVNTGDQRADIIAVALTQVGYREGYNNDTKYGDWYGLPHQPWCAMFISWCANQAGVPTSVLGKGAMANPWSFGLSTYFTSSQRGPQPGDIFFKKDFGHTGFVLRVEGDYFYTVEGNTNDNNSNDGIGVFTLRRKLSDYYFSSPSYTTDAGHDYVKGYEEEHPHKEYYYCSHCNGFYYTGATAASQTCTTCIQAACTHQYGDWTPAPSGHKRTCTLCQKEETVSHSWDGGTVLTAATCGKAGSLRHSCTVCAYEETTAITPTGKHDWSTWSGDETGHTRICGNCGQKETQAHTPPETWEVDETTHSYYCTACQYFCEGEHAYPEGCETPCGDCGYLPENGHDLQWQSDGENHWAICTRCDQESQRGVHVFEGDCDALCDDCGYVRQVDHLYGKDYEKDHFGHWLECTLCGGKSEVQPHVPGAEATEEQAQCCTECGYEITAKLPHEHRYEQLEFDSAHHWGTCACGYEMEQALHAWGPDGLCAVCSTKAQPAGGQLSQVLLWCLIPGGCALAGIVIFLVLRRRKQKKTQEVSEEETNVSGA